MLIIIKEPNVLFQRLLFIHIQFVPTSNGKKLVPRDIDDDEWSSSQGVQEERFVFVSNKIKFIDLSHISNTITSIMFHWNLNNFTISLNFLLMQP